MSSITLSQDKVALVDDADFEHLSQWKWHYDAGYAYRNIPISKDRQKRVAMHNVIMSPMVGKEVDHINNDGLDNRRDNLRLGTHRQNTFNRSMNKNNKSGFKGVSWYPKYNKWRASAYIAKGKQVAVGYFENKKEAAIAYNTFVLERYGEFAKVNRV